MNGLRNEIFDQCRHVLENCDEFANQDNLKALFFCQELSPYTGRLPEAANIHDRVSLTIEYLLRQRRDVEGRWVILNFLKVLRDKYEFPHGKREELGQLYNLVEGELQNVFEGIEIPFVTLAMTQDEANNLFCNPDFPSLNGIDHSGFLEFAHLLRKTEDDVLSHYDVLRDYWKPFILNNEDTRIESLVKGLFEDVNYTRRLKGLPEVYATFYTQGFFAEDIDVCNLLYENGCIVIADVLSLFHTTIWNTYDQSTIRNRKEKAAMIVLTPEIAFKTSINTYIEEFLKTKMKWHFVVEFEQHLLRLYEFNVGDLRTFKRRLFTMVPDAIRILQNQQPDPESLASLQKIQKTSIGSHLFGGWR
jgi:hypothetical protein